MNKALTTRFNLNLIFILPPLIDHPIIRRIQSKFEKLTKHINNLLIQDMPSEESYKKIEGDWKDFRFRRILPSDHAAVFEHIANHFLRDEPTAKLLGWSQDYVDDTNRILEMFLTHGMSFLVEHRESGKVLSSC